MDTKFERDFEDYINRLVNRYEGTEKSIYVPFIKPRELSEDRCIDIMNKYGLTLVDGIRGIKYIKKEI